jgi:hypothetical protein
LCTLSQLQVHLLAFEISSFELFDALESEILIIAFHGIDVDHHLDLVLHYFLVRVEKSFNFRGAIFEMVWNLLLEFVFLCFVVESIQLCLELVASDEWNEVLGNVEPAIVVFLLEMQQKLVGSMRKDIHACVSQITSYLEVVALLEERVFNVYTTGVVLLAILHHHAVELVLVCDALSALFICDVTQTVDILSFDICHLWALS